MKFILEDTSVAKYLNNCAEYFQHNRNSISNQVRASVPLKRKDLLKLTQELNKIQPNKNHHQRLLKVAHSLGSRYTPSQVKELLNADKKEDADVYKESEVILSRLERLISYIKQVSALFEKLYDEKEQIKLEYYAKEIWCKNSPGAYFVEVYTAIRLPNPYFLTSYGFYQDDYSIEDAEQEDKFYLYYHTMYVTVVKYSTLF